MSQISDRVSKLDLSGIRKVFDLAAKLKDPVNFSIGQPDFKVPQAIKVAAQEAIFADANGYTPTQGYGDLIEALKKNVQSRQLNFEDLIVTSGVSGGLFLAFSTLLNPGDEVVMADPYFLMYRQLAQFLDAKAIYVDTHPDFQLTAAKLEPHLNARTKLLVLNFPGNPTGVGLAKAHRGDLIDLLRRNPHITVLSDEIYRLFFYDDDFYSPASELPSVITLDGFSKSHALTGWRLGWAHGPRLIIQQMAKLQQFTFVCAPSFAQKAAITALHTCMDAEREQYRAKRDLICNLIRDRYQIVQPDGTFYLYPKVPRAYPNAQSFVEAALKKNLLVIPGNVFSNRDTHFRISFATSEQNLRKGAAILNALAEGNPDS